MTHLRKGYSEGYEAGAKEERERAERAEARVAELESAIHQVVDAHDGTHDEDCRAAFYGPDADLPEEPSDADPVCTCGATHERERARRVAKGLGVWPEPTSPSVSKEESRPARTKHYFPLPDMAKCGGCGGAARVELDVGRSGYSVGSGHEHAADCPTTRCPHGVRWAESCELCDEDEQAESDEEEDDIGF